MKNVSAAKDNHIDSLNLYDEGKKLYKEACVRCPNDPALFINILYMSGEIAEAEALEFYLQQERLTTEKDESII